MFGSLTLQWRKLRRWLRWLVALALLLLVLASAAGVWFYRAITPPTPSAFYTPPDPLPPGDPGTLISLEQLPKRAGAQAWRVMYLSTGVNGDPIAVTGVIVGPEDPGDQPRPVVAWARGTVGILPQCGVSHTRDPYRQTPVLDLMVNQGFVVVATDYPGLGTPGIHPYLVGPVSAYSVLDSVRAAQGIPELGAGSRFGVWGASQGGQVSLWTAQLASGYAPELDLVGAAAAAPALNLAGFIAAKHHDIGGGVFLSEALYAWSHVYANAHLDDIIQPQHRRQFERMARTCISTPLAFLTLGKLLTPADYLSADILSLDPWRTIITENAPQGSLSVPLLIAHGTADTLIPIELSEADVDRRCAAGENVQFLRYPGVGHDARDESSILTVGWLGDRFANRVAPSSCS